MPLVVLNGPIIAAGESLSSGIDCTGANILRITMPAVWTPANLSFQISTDGAFYNDLFRGDGVEIIVPVVAGTAVVVAHLREYLEAIGYLKVRSGSRGWPVVQAAQRDFAIAVQTSV